VNIRVGLVEGREAVTVRLEGSFLGDDGRVFPSGAYSFTEPRHLSPRDPERARFAVPDVTIGIGFHWERRQEQVFRGALSLERDPRGLTLVNELSIEDYVGSVIASEMSAASPLDFLKAHAVISRSWAVAQIRASGTTGHFRRESRSDAGEPEILAWYGREAHTLFDLCADDHCQRYQGVAPVVGDDVRRAVL
jgi:peptidoglycan hydrolase-like amidase